MALALLDADERIELTDAELGVADGDPETVYILRPITVADYRVIVKRHTSDVLNRRTHQREPKVDMEAVNDAVFDYVLQDWRGILFRGEPVPCVWEHKVKLDPARRNALLDAAGMNRVLRQPEDRADSFRGAEGVRDVVGQ